MAAIERTLVDPQKPPIAATLAVLLAMGTLFAVDGLNYLIPILALVAVASSVTSYRIENTSAVVWPMRLIIYGLLFGANATRVYQVTNASAITNSLDHLGLIASGEIALRYWLRRSDGQSEMPAILFWTGTVFLAVCQTDKPIIVAILTPILFILYLFAFPLYRQRPTPMTTSASGRFSLYLRGALALIAISAGYGVLVLIDRNQSQIEVLGDRMLNGNPNLASHVDSSGLSLSPILGNAPDIPVSTQRMLRLDNYGGDSHLRAMAFDTYYRVGWQPPGDARETTSITQDKLNADAAGIVTTVTRYNQEGNVVFFPLDAAGLDPMGSALTSVDFENGGPVLFTGDTPLQYGIILDPKQKERGWFNRDPSSAERALDLTVPEDVDPRVRELAFKVGGKLPTQMDKIQAVELFLVRNNTYSRATTAASGPLDPVSNFILDKKSADCEYFASAAVILLRCIGVPSRYVIGYYVHEQESPGVMVVRAEDAHAWAESWIKGVGWVTVDATPADGRPSDTATSPSPYQRWSEKLQDWLNTFRDWLGQLTPAQFGLVIATLMISMGIFIYFRSRTPRTKRAIVSSYTVTDEALRSLSARFSRWMRVRGLPCPENRTWYEHLRYVEAHGLWTDPQELLEEALLFVEEYYATRFGLVHESIEYAVRHLDDRMVSLENWSKAEEAGTASKR